MTDTRPVGEDSFLQSSDGFTASVHSHRARLDRSARAREKEGGRWGRP